MKRILLVSCLAAGAAFAAEPAATAAVTVNLAEELGPIKPMNAVNNGPTVKKPGGDQVRGNFEDYKAARIPLARTHDSINCVAGGAHTCDINAIFRNFDADETEELNSTERKLREFIRRLNPDSLTVKKGYAEPIVREAPSGSTYQFLRTGYFCKDPDSTDALPVFNRTVSLRDSFSKQKAGA